MFVITLSRVRTKTITVTANELTLGDVSEIIYTNRYAAMGVTKFGSAPTLIQNMQLARP